MIIPGVKCLHPVLVKTPDAFLKKRVFENGEIVEYNHFPSLTVGCGKCICCKMRRTREWSLRLIMESKSYNPDEVWFLTLTYDDEHVPLAYDESDGNYQMTLVKRDHQLFMKRLRKRCKYYLKYFFVGEYGSRTGRSHLHAVIFGLQARDVHFVDDCWQKGFVLCKSFYNETAGYVAGYIQKKLFGKNVYGVSQPPYLSCSQHLGEDYFWQNVDDICKKGFIVEKGFKYPIPRIFARKAIERGFLPPIDCDELELLQKVSSEEFYDWVDRNNIQISDYERNFRLIQENHFKRFNVTRDTNEVV